MKGRLIGMGDKQLMGEEEGETRTVGAHRPELYTTHIDSISIDRSERGSRLGRIKSLPYPDSHESSQIATTQNTSDQRFRVAGRDVRGCTDSEER